ncbi:hypothetical protein GCM10010341_39790 [Streptomyces noursei]|nr:hypothetical protein GCM10010341_39790 [Streptomyces noursei]
MFCDDRGTAVGPFEALLSPGPATTLALGLPPPRVSNRVVWQAAAGSLPREGTPVRPFDCRGLPYSAASADRAKIAAGLAAKALHGLCRRLVGGQEDDQFLRVGARQFQSFALPPQFVRSGMVEPKGDLWWG